MSAEMMKRCSRCNEWKALGSFALKRTESRDGRQSYCKACMNAAVRRWEKTVHGKTTKNKSRRTQRANYTDGYVRRILAKSLGCSRTEVPLPLIVAKRSYLMGRQLIKEMSK